MAKSFAQLAARMAGMPREFLTTARETLERLQLEEAGRAPKASTV
jgi:DNA mismatch repair ATPase MutS